MPRHGSRRANDFGLRSQVEHPWLVTLAVVVRETRQAARVSRVRCGTCSRAHRCQPRPRCGRFASRRDARTATRCGQPTPGRCRAGRSARRRRRRALRGIVWVMWGHVESAGSTGTMIGTPTGVCLPGRLGSITLGHGKPTVEMAHSRSLVGHRARRARAALDRPPTRRAVVVPRWRSWRPAGVDTFVPRALEYGTGERSQRTAVSRGIAAVVVCGT